MNAKSHAARGLVAFLVPLVLLLPFAGKAFHIDDPVYIWMAQRIIEHPLDPYGSSVNWSMPTTAPMYIDNKNPPGVSYWLAAAGGVFGWSEIAIHLSMAVLAGVAGLGTYVLARELCNRPLTATLIAVLAPGFFVSTTTVMSDVPMTALYVWSLALWVLGVKRKRARLLLLASILMGGAILVKYFAATLIPLTLIYAAVLAPKSSRWWAWHYITPIAIVGAYLAWAYWRYEINLFTSAADLALLPEWRGERTPVAHFLTGVTFIGACSASLALMSPFLWSRRALGYGLAGAATLIAALCVPSLFDRIALKEVQHTPGYRIQVGLWIAAGIHIVALIVIDLRRRRDSGAVMLACWIVGTFVFSVYVNYMINARTLLPILPALGILAARRLDTLDTGGEAALLRPQWIFVPLSVAAFLSVWVAAGDYEYANASRTAAQEFSRNRDRFSEHVYFFEHWGFQYYMEQAGARPLEKTLTLYNAEFYRPVQSGDTLAVPHAHSANWMPDAANHPVIAFYSYPMRWRMRTMTKGAGFYGHYWGMLPFVIGEAVPEAFVFIKVL